MLIVNEHTDDLAPDYAAEAARDEKWDRFRNEVVEFAQSEPDGFAAVLRAVAEAMKHQPSLIR